MRGSVTFALALLVTLLGLAWVAGGYLSGISVSPGDGENAVHPARSLRAHFDEDVLGADIVVRLETTGETPQPVGLSLDARERQIRILPDRPLDWSRDYRLCVEASLPLFARWPQFAPMRERRCSSFRTMDKPPLRPVAHGPILLATGNLEPFASYYGEILKAEGLNLYATADVSQIDAATLASRKLVILAGATLPATALAALRNWTEAGGVLVAMRPGAELLALAGMVKAPPPAPPRRLYLTQQEDGHAGEAPRRLRIHGPVDFYRFMEANTASAQDALPETPSAIATLSARDGPLDYPAIVSRNVGSGRVVAFAFDLARSVVLTRQGNPAWQNEERDGSAPRRPNDLFFPDFVDIDNLASPQADEQQRLLANLIETSVSVPLPRYWYLPDARKAAVVMVGDDHATPEGTSDLFKRLASLSPPDCRLEDWTCLRATSLLTPRKKFTAAHAKDFERQGFELGLHLDAGCKDLNNEKFEAQLTKQLGLFRYKYAGLTPQSTTRTHCIAWYGWVDAARVEQRHGLHLDFNYYHWPPEWLDGHSGFLTGSGFPMPFVTEDGDVLATYQAESHLVNQDGAPQREGIALMLDNALGENGYYGAFGTHFDYSDDYDTILTDEARKRGVALISGAQLLAWTQGRNQSAFSQLHWHGDDLLFTQHLASGAERATVMLPAESQGLALASIRCGSEQMATTRRAIGTVEYRLFPARNGECRASYR